MLWNSIGYFKINLIYPFNRQQNASTNQRLLSLISKCILSCLQINDVPLSGNLELNVVVDYLQQQDQVLEFQKLKEYLFGMQTQLDLVLVLYEFVDSEAAC